MVDPSVMSQRAATARHGYDGCRRGGVTVSDLDQLAGRFEADRAAPAGGRLPDARLAGRGRRRRAGGLAAAQPRRHRRGRQPHRLADDRGVAGSASTCCARGRLGARNRSADVPETVLGRRRRPGARGAARRRDRAGAALVLERWRPRSGWRSCCTTCSPCRSRRSPRSPGRPRRRPGSWPAGPRRRCRGARRTEDPGPLPCRGRGLSGRLPQRRLRRAAGRAGSRGRAARRPRRSLGGRPPGQRGERGGRRRSRAGPSTRRLALLDGEPGALWSAGGQPRVAFAFTIADGLITGVELIADPADLCGHGS